MVFKSVSENEKEPSPGDLQFAIQRNFGGYFGNFDPADVFLGEMGKKNKGLERISSKDLIKDAIESGKHGSR